MRLYLVLIFLLPLLGGVTNALAGRKMPRRVVETIACASVWGSFLFSLLAFLAYRQPVTVELLSWLADFDFKAPISLHLDPLAMVMCLMVTFVCGLIHVYSIAYMAKDQDYVRFFAIMNLFVFAMLMLVLAENLPLLYLGWEGVGFCSYALIGFWYREKKNVDAGRKAFIVTRIGDTAFGIAIVWMFQLFNTVSIPEINSMGFLMPAGIITTLGILFLIGAMGKSAQIPLMVWLPDAMAGPTPVSAQIHAATMVTAGVYILMRMFPLIGTSPETAIAIAVTGGVTAFYGATCAMAQRDLKRILAYSTISQIGYMILAVGVGAITAAAFHLVVHAFFKALLFLAAGCIIAGLHHQQDIFKMGGLRRSMPLVFWLFLAGGACLAAFPLTGGFFSKDAILSAVFQEGGALYLSLYIIGLVTAFLTSFYTFRAIYLAFGGNGEQPLSPVPTIMKAILVPLAIIALFGGLLDLPVYLGGPGWLSRFLTGGTAKHLAPHGIEIMLQAFAGVLTIAGLALAHMRYGGAARQARIAESESTPSAITSFLLNGWYVDRLYQKIFIRPYEGISNFLWTRVDEGIIDRSLDRLAMFVAGMGKRFAGWTSGKISLYLISFAVGAAGIIAYMAFSAGR